MTAFYEAKVVSNTGTVLQTFDASGRQIASVEDVGWELNEPGAFGVRLPLFDAATRSVIPLQREIQVWRNGSLLHWGLPVQVDVQGHSVLFTCPGVPWPMTQRVFGPITVNYLTNGLFTSNLSSWTAVGCTATWSNAIRIRGPGTARLVSATSGDNYIEQSFTVTTGALGLFLSVAAWYYIDPTVTPFSPAYLERGLYVQSPQAVHGVAPRWEPLTMNADKGKPQRAVIKDGISLPPSTTCTVVTRLYSPRGAIHWGAAHENAEESVSADPGGSDVTEMMRRIVDYAQNGAGKSSLNIAVPAVIPAGVSEFTAWQYKDLGNIWEALQSYSRRGLADFDFVLTPTTRTFQTYSPRKGSLKSGYGIVVPGSAVISTGYRLDGAQTATQNIVRGTGEGSDREIGVASDTSHTGGLTLDHVEDAPPEMSIDGLDGMAATNLARLSRAVDQIDVQVRASSWLGNVVVGDTVPVTIDWGWVQVVAGTLRVSKMVLDPKTDLIRPTLVVP